jgi:hypothetical protein
LHLHARESSPHRDDGMIVLRWEERPFESFALVKREGEPELGLYPSETWKGKFLLIEVSDFGPFGEEAWINALTRRRLKRRQIGSPPQHGSIDFPDPP